MTDVYYKLVDDYDNMYYIRRKEYTEKEIKKKSKEKKKNLKQELEFT